MVNIIAKPFLKWAGGKTQLIGDIQQVLPAFAYNDEFTYIEPFVGSGAMLFWMRSNFPHLKKAVINDINEDLIHTYRTIATEPDKLIYFLNIMEKEYHALEGHDQARRNYYYTRRDLYNTRKADKTVHAALFIFLNRTCFNGLYRVNRKNEFNVPIGSYKRPTICDEDNILAVSQALQGVEILCGDFEETLGHADGRTLFYFDPPYKPMSETSSFNSYAKEAFDDAEQIRLMNFCRKLDTLGYAWILSNSDAKGKDENDNFFEELYSDFNIMRVDAVRSINSNPEKRGTVKELLITNKTTSREYVKAKCYS